MSTLSITPPLFSNNSLLSLIHSSAATSIVPSDFTPFSTLGTIALSSIITGLAHAGENVSRVKVSDSVSPAWIHPFGSPLVSRKPNCRLKKSSPTTSKAYQRTQTERSVGWPEAASSCMRRRKMSKQALTPGSARTTLVIE